MLRSFLSVSRIFYGPFVIDVRKLRTIIAGLQILPFLVGAVADLALEKLERCPSVAPTAQYIPGTLGRSSLYLCVQGRISGRDARTRCSTTMDIAQLNALQAFVSSARADPSSLNKPELAFFRDYLSSLGASLPPAATNGAGATVGVVTALGSVAEWEEVLSKGGNAVIDFTATWCPPCKAIKPVFKKLAEENQDVAFFSVDVDEAKDMASKYDISSMPTFKFFSDGKVVDELQGASPPDLKSKVAALARGGGGGDGCDGENGAGAEKCGVSDDEEEVVIPPMPVMADGDEDDEGDPDVIPESERDSPPFPVIGSDSADLSEADMEKQMAAKIAASDLASSGDFEGALEKWNTVVSMKPSPLTLAKRADILLKLRRPNAAIADCDAALKLNPDSAKSLKTRGKAYRLLGDWEKASADLGQGNTIDFDEESAEIQKVVQSHWSRIRDRKLKHAAAMRSWETEKNKIERAAARKKAQKQYEQQKAHESSETPMPGMPDIGLTPEMQEKLKDPKIASKLSGIFAGLQGGEFVPAEMPSPLKSTILGA